MTRTKGHQLRNNPRRMTNRKPLKPRKSLLKVNQMRMKMTKMLRQEVMRKMMIMKKRAAKKNQLKNSHPEKHLMFLLANLRQRKQKVMKKTVAINPKNSS